MEPDDEVTIQQQFDPIFEIFDFEFADSTVLTTADVLNIIAQEGPGHVTHRGINAAETIVGTGYDDVIDGRGGGDLLQGGWGSDTYIYGVPDRAIANQAARFIQRTVEVDRCTLSVHAVALIVMNRSCCCGQA